MAYVQILLSVVLAPFWIIGGIVPGSPISIGGWFKNIGANLLAFPIVLAMFMLARIFIDTFGEHQASGQFIPPLIGNPGTTGVIGSIIGLGIILMTPNVVTMLKVALKAPKMDTGIGKGIGVGPAGLINTAKSYGGMEMGRREIITTGVKTDGSAEWGPRGLPKAIFGKLTGRG
jgi:hypothetical protein